MSVTIPSGGCEFTVDPQASESRRCRLRAQDEVDGLAVCGRHAEILLKQAAEALRRAIATQNDAPARPAPPPPKPAPPVQRCRCASYRAALTGIVAGIGESGEPIGASGVAWLAENAVLAGGPTLPKCACRQMSLALRRIARAGLNRESLQEIARVALDEVVA